MGTPAKAAAPTGKPRPPELQSCHSERRRKMHGDTDKDAVSRLASVIREEAERERLAAEQELLKPKPMPAASVLPAFDPEALRRLAEEAAKREAEEPEPMPEPVSAETVAVLQRVERTAEAYAAAPAPVVLPVGELQPPTTPSQSAPSIKPIGFGFSLGGKSQVSRAPKPESTAAAKAAAASAAKLAEATERAKVMSSTSIASASKSMKGGHMCMGPTRGIKKKTPEPAPIAAPVVVSKPTIVERSAPQRAPTARPGGFKQSIIMVLPGGRSLGMSSGASSSPAEPPPQPAPLASDAVPASASTTREHDSKNDSQQTAPVQRPPDSLDGVEANGAPGAGRSRSNSHAKSRIANRSRSRRRKRQKSSDSSSGDAKRRRKRGSSEKGHRRK